MQPHRGTLILVLGILSIIICPILAPFAWMMGNKDLKAIDAGQMDPEGKGSTNGGKICGLIGTILLILYIIGGIIFAVGIGAAATAVANDPEFQKGLEEATRQIQEAQQTAPAPAQ